MKISKLTLCSLGLLFAAGQALAHTGVRDTAEEGKASYNGFTITHGCGGEAGSVSYPVIGQSAVFPYGSNAVWRTAAVSDKPETPENEAVPATFLQLGGDGNGTIKKGATLSLAVTGYAGGSPFATSQELVDSKAVVQGLFWKDGVMPPNMNAITSFKITAPTIDNPCVKTLGIRIGVINYCDTGKNAANDIKGPYFAPTDGMRKPVPMTNSPATGFVQANAADAPVFRTTPKRGNGDNNRADWWFTALEGGSALYNDPELLQPTYWTTLIVNNKAADLALCTGKQFDVTVEPNGAAVDAILTGPNTQPFTKGNTGL
jgi:hypothetical protein